MLGINKITVSEQFDMIGDRSYIIEVSYYLQTEKDEFGLPALDLSRDTKLYAQFSRRTNMITEQSLAYPTYLGTKLNPDIQTIPTGYKYPFYAKFNIDKDEDLSQYNLVLSLKQNNKSSRAQVVVELFVSGALKIENDASVPIEDKRTNFYDNIFNFDLFTAGNQQNNATVSELYLSYGKNTSIKGMFFFDKQKFLIDNSDFGKILNNPKLPKRVRNEIMRKSSINTLKITRRKLSYLRDFHNRPYRAYANQVPKTVAIGYEESGLLVSTKGILSEAGDIDLSGIDYEKIITFNDTELQDTGRHQYSLDMRLEDGILKWLIGSLESLTLITSSIEQGSMMRLSVPRLIRILFSLNSNLEISQKDLTKYLINLRKHDGSRLLFASYLVNLINKISNLIGSSGLISQTNSSYSKVYSQNNSELFFLNISKQFLSITNFDDAKDLTYDYLGIPENTDIGASRIGKGIMRTRADREYEKLLKSPPETSFVNLSKEIFADVFGSTPANETKTSDGFSTLQLAYFNFEPNYFAYLSPVIVGSTILTRNNTFNFNTMTTQHFKKKYDSSLTPQLSISYYLQNQGVSLGPDFFLQDPPLQDKTQGSTYFPSNSIFADSDKINTRAPLIENFKAGIEVEKVNNASRTFASMFLRNEEGWELSREDFDLTNTTNMLTSAMEAPAKTRSATPSAALSSQLSIISQMPNQIRAIFASSSDKCVNQWLSPSMEGDYIYSPTTYYTIKQNYMNLVKIEYLSGFKNDENGIPDIKNPIFKKLTDLSGSGKIICRASIYNDERFRIGVGFDRISYADEYFILDLTD